MSKPKSFKTKLWLYFVLFAAIIFSVLWLLQTVFLQGFYNMMLMNNTRSAVEKIVSNGESDDINNIIDEAARSNSILIYVTDPEGNPLYISDEYKKNRKNHMNDNGGSESGHVQKMQSDGAEDQQTQDAASNKKTESGSSETDNIREEKEKTENGAHIHGKENNGKEGYRQLPDDYGEFLTKVIQSADGIAEYTENGQFIYGKTFSYKGAEGESIIYTGTMLGAVGSAVDIIRIQLAIVTGLSLVIAFILAWFIARRFSKPLGQLSDKAVKLGEEGAAGDFGKGFCSEIDGLNAVLDKTSEKLKETKSFQIELLANVSHDLRTPLTMIKGYAEEVGDYSWSDEKQRKEDIGVIIRETDRLTALVNEIMEYSELQSVDGLGDYEDVDLSVLIKRVADNFDSLYKREGFTIEREIAEKVTVAGNAAKLERLVVNLMDNAIRHAGEDKKVTVRLEKRTDETDAVHFEVTDHGDGIDPELMPHIWEKYYTSRQRGNKGVSGLGLAIVKQIAQLHGAEYGVESEKGKGSRFYIDFPAILKTD